MFWVLLLQEKKEARNMITGISEFVFFVQKWLFRHAHLFFKKCFAETPYLYSVFWVRAFWAKLPKKEILDTHQKRKND